MQTMTKEHAQKLFDRWVSALGLGEWEIRFNWRVRGIDMPDREMLGVTRYCLSSMQAEVSMVAEEDAPESGFAYDYERTLVHELMHIKLAVVDDSGDEVHDNTVHMLVEQMARALVKAKRGEANC